MTAKEQAVLTIYNKLYDRARYEWQEYILGNSDGKTLAETEYALKTLIAAADNAGYKVVCGRDGKAIVRADSDVSHGTVLTAIANAKQQLDRPCKEADAKMRQAWKVYEEAQAECAKRQAEANIAKSVLTDFLEAVKEN